VTCGSTTLCLPSTTAESISTPRLMGPGCITMASLLASCYLCPGNARVGGTRNPAYTSTFVFDNDFAALKPATESERLDIGGLGLLVAQGEPGICRVICFSPRHDLTLATMSTKEIEPVVQTWMEQFRELGNRQTIHCVQIFENRGSMMGASNPHPHCQIWATASLPVEPAK